MLFQFKNLKDGSVCGYSTAIQLQVAVQKLTGDSTEALNVFEWATTPVCGCFRYDHADFEITIIGQSDVYM